VQAQREQRTLAAGKGRTVRADSRRRLAARESVASSATLSSTPEDSPSRPIHCSRPAGRQKVAPRNEPSTRFLLAHAATLPNLPLARILRLEGIFNTPSSLGGALDLRGRARGASTALCSELGNQSWASDACRRLLSTGLSWGAAETMPRRRRDNGSRGTGTPLCFFATLLTTLLTSLLARRASRAR